MPSASDIILNIVCPLLGTITAYQMFYAPVPDVYKALRRGSLNDLNPLPWAFLMGNCLGWVLYSVLNQDVWLLVANSPGFVIAVWLNLAASKLQYQQQFQVLPPVAATDTALMTIPEDKALELPPTPEISEEYHEKSIMDNNKTYNDDSIENPNNESSIAALYEPLQDGSENNAETALQPGAAVMYKVPPHDYWVMGITIGWVIILAIIGFGQSLSPEVKNWIVGIITNFNLLFFYGAPLSTIATILKTRNTASIHTPTMTMNTINSCFWTAYGFAIFDFFVLVPNGIGALLGFTQVFLYMTFPRDLDETPNTIAATVIVGDTTADAVVMGDPTSDDAVIMMNKEDVERLKHSIAVDQKLGGVQVITSGVPAFPSTVEPILVDQEMRRNHRRCVTYAGLPTTIVDNHDLQQDPNTTSYGTALLPPSADGAGTTTNNNITNSPNRTGGRPRRGGPGHGRSASYGGTVALINLSEHRRKASASDVVPILDLLDQQDFLAAAAYDAATNSNRNDNSDHPHHHHDVENPPQGGMM